MDTLDLTDFASRIVHPLVRSLESTPELRVTGMDTLSSLALQLNRRYLTFVPMVSRALVKHRISHQRYEQLLIRIAKVGHLFIKIVFKFVGVWILNLKNNGINIM